MKRFHSEPKKACGLGWARAASVTCHLITIIKINPCVKLCVPWGERVWQGGGCDRPRLLLAAAVGADVGAAAVCAAKLMLLL